MKENSTASNFHSDIERICAYMSILDVAQVFAYAVAVSKDIHIIKRNKDGEYCIANETKLKNVTIKDLAHDFLEWYANGPSYRSADNDSVDSDNIIAEDRFVTQYNKMGQPYKRFIDDENDLTEEEKAELDINPVTGGRYDYVKYCNKSSEHEVHHIISAEALKKTGFLDFNTGPCIRILKDDHRLTKSYGKNNESKIYREKQIKLIKEGKIREVIKEEIKQIRLKFGSKYNNELREMLRYVKTLENNNWKVRK